MTGAWTINIGGKIYGPYTVERMRGFAGEGRLSAQSLVAREGTIDWHEAHDDPELEDLFIHGANGATKHEAVPGTNGNAAATPATQPIGAAISTQAPAVTPAGAEAAVPGRAQFMIVADMKSRGTNKFDEAILSLGPAQRLLPNVWILSSEQTVNAVRNQLVQELGKLDSLFVIDATRGKAAWFNFGPEMDSKIRRVWQKAH